MSGELRTPPRFRPAVLLLCLAPALAFGWRAVPGVVTHLQAAGQSKPTTDQQVLTPTFRTEANFVRVDVYPF